MAGSLVDEGLADGGVGDQLLGLEPQVDLHLGVLQGVAAVDDVPARKHTHAHVSWTPLWASPPAGGGHSPADVDAQVSSDAAGFGVGGVGLAQHHAAQLDDAPPLPHLTHTRLRVIT